VDVYSLSMVLYEIFSGSEPFQECDFLQIMGAIFQNKRPTLQSDFPADLGVLVCRGWSSVYSERPKILELQEVLESMKAEAWDDDTDFGNFYCFLNRQTFLRLPRYDIFR